MRLHFKTGGGPLSVELSKLTVAGWTGRDQAAVNHHIEELAAIGVPRPSRTPLFYQVSPTLATQAEAITVLGGETSGEVEPLLIRAERKLWLGLASDHTDRGLEAQSVARAKQICAKPVADRLWPFDLVADRLDNLNLRCWIGAGADRHLYQDGTFADILPLSTLLEAAPLAEGEAMLCGTLPAIGGVVPATTYEMELSDDTGGGIRFGYTVQPLEVVA